MKSPPSGEGGGGVRGGGVRGLPNNPDNNAPPTNKKHDKNATLLLFLWGGLRPPSHHQAPQQHHSSTPPPPPPPHPDHTQNPHLYSADASSRRDAGNFLTIGRACSSVHSEFRFHLLASTRQAGAGISVQVAWGKYHRPQK